jgi:small conductance mechanosensitive channel
MPLTTVLAGLGLIGFAVSFAAQNLIKSMINGLMILVNDSYGIGDVVALGNQAEGSIEKFNLIYTQLRSGDGDLITIANADINLVCNKSKDWSRVNFTIQVDYGADIERALQIIARTARELYHDSQWSHLFLEPPEVLGLDEVSHTGMLIRVWFKVQPLQQWSVGREFRRRLKIALDQENIRVGVPQTILVDSDNGGAREPEENSRG